MKKYLWVLLVGIFLGASIQVGIGFSKERLSYREPELPGMTWLKIKWRGQTLIPVNKSMNRGIPGYLCIGDSKSPKGNQPLIVFFIPLDEIDE